MIRCWCRGIVGLTLVLNVVERGGAAPLPPEPPPPLRRSESGSAPNVVRSAAAQARSSLLGWSRDLEALAQRVTPSVVQIVARGYAPPGSGGVLLTRQRSTGSGVIVDPLGYVITNAHVVQGGRRIQVRLPPRRATPGGSVLRQPGRTFEAKVLGLDRETDLAVLKVDGEGFPALAFADSDELRQGEIVLAFGSPLGFDDSMTLGVVSALARQLRRDDPMVYLQTDAAINPGNSGGPLVDVEGRVVGINTLIASQGGGSEGIGFAAPSNIVRTVYEQLRRNGRVRRGWIGTRAQTVTPLIAEGLGLPAGAAVILADVAAETPASLAGLTIGDVVTSVDGRPVDNARQFDVRLYRKAVGESVTLELLRAGRALSAQTVVVDRPDDPDRFAMLATEEKNLVPRLGILGLELDDALRGALSPLRGRAGVVVAARAGGGDDEGLQPGDVIYSVNGVSVQGLSELRAAVARVASSGPIVLQIERSGGLLYVDLEAE